MVFVNQRQLRFFSLCSFFMLLKNKYNIYATAKYNPKIKMQNKKNGFP